MQSLVSSLGPVAAIIGTQWGDEGKGKVTDVLGGYYDVIARACGGANAGHTIVVGGKKHVFRLLPSGCLHEDKVVVLGSGMVIHIPTLLEEINLLKLSGIDITKRLKISGAAHIVFDYHKEIDGVLEGRREQAIGTTKKGIGPAYMDKAARIGIRMERIHEDLRLELRKRSETMMQMYGVRIDVDAETNALVQARGVVGSCIVPSLPALMMQYASEKRSILIEGAQAALLDIDHGTYPFVTSSATTVAGALQGLGLSPRTLTGCVGVTKAYCTRVGEGAFPGEQSGERGERLRERGGEYGSVTKRPRRCGWLSIPDLQQSLFMNGCTHVNLTKLDVLDEEESIPVLLRLKPNGTPVFSYRPGWRTSTAGMTHYEDLPTQAKAFIEFLENELQTPIAMIGTGQPSEHVILR